MSFTYVHAGFNSNSASKSQVNEIDWPGIVSEIILLLSNNYEKFADFWHSLKPLFYYPSVQHISLELQNAADNLIQNIKDLPDYLTWLYENGYSREDSRQIRYVIEVFYNLEPVIAVLGGIGLLMRGKVDDYKTEYEDDSAIFNPPFSGPVEFIKDDSSAFLQMAVQKYGDFIHPFFRAIAVWPDFMHKLWEDIILQRASEIKLLSELLRAKLDSFIEDIIDPINDEYELSFEVAYAIENFLEVSMEVMLICAIVRRSFVSAESKARDII